MEAEFILLIMNCKKYIKKAEYQKQTWIPNLPSYIKYYHVIGDETMDCSFKFDNERNILWLKVADDYNSLPKKVINAYSAVFQTFQFKYIFKTDDDQMVTNIYFFDILKNILTNNPTLHYGGHIVDVKENYLSQYYKIHPELPKHLPVLKTKYCSGRFYFLSKQAIANLLIHRSSIEKEYLEDYAIGYHLDQCYKNNMLNLITDKYFKDIDMNNIDKIDNII